jgi:hypothetical protein
MTFKQMLRFMLDNGIDETEYLLLMCMYYKNIDEDIPPLIKKYAERYGVQIDGKWQMFSVHRKDKLVEKGFLIEIGYEKFQLTDMFLDLFVTEVIAGNEMIDYYPSYIKINGSNIPLKTSNRMELRKMYWNAIGGQRSEHEQVRLDIRYGKKEELLNMNITKFIEAEFWRDLREMRKDESNNNIIPDDF